MESGAVQVRIFATLRDIVGTKQIDVPVGETSTVREVLRDMTQAYPELGARLWNDQGGLSGLVTVFVNGRTLFALSGLDTPVRPADILALFPPVGGG
jgi:molybdopterin synthase sulfur carrier subunit